MADSDNDGDHGRRRFLEGNPATLDQAKKTVEAVMRHWGIPAGERDEIMQQALVQTIERLNTPGFVLRKDVACLLSRIAQARCIDWRRRQRRQRQMEPVKEDLPDRRTGPDGVILKNEREEIARLVIEKLSPSCRRLIDLHFDQNLPYAVIAALLERSEGGLRVQMYHCLEKARQLIQGSDEDPPRPTASGRAVPPRPPVDSRPVGSK